MTSTLLRRFASLPLAAALLTSGCVTTGSSTPTVAPTVAPSAPPSAVLAATATATATSTAAATVTATTMVTSTPTITSTSTPGAAVGGARVTIEATYNITGELRPLISAPAGGAQQAGVRVEFPLARRSEGVTIVNTHEQLRAAVADDAPLLYWIARTDESPDPILVSVGADEPLGRLRLDGVTDIAPLVPPERAGEVVPLDAEDQLTSRLGGPGADVEQLVVWLETPGGRRYPLAIRAVSHVATALDAKDLFSNAYLALLRRADGTYRAVVVLPDEASFGPPNQSDVERCATLIGGGLWTQLLRQWYGC